MSVVTMLQRIEAERKDQKLCEIRELVLDGCSATEINGLNDEYLGLEKLSMAGVGLTTLDGLPALPSLLELDVSGNPIAGCLKILKGCPNLVNINLSGNKLPAISSLAPLASLENLTRLDLSNCDLVSIEGYRKEVFALLPQLKFLDGLDQNGVEEPDERFAGDGVNGFKNGHAVIDANEELGEDDEDDDEIGKDDDDEEDEDEETDSEEEKDDVGLSALQGSKDLEDDEEDYVPGGGDDDVEEDDEEDDDENADESENDEDEVANLSGAGVTGPRLGQKRAADNAEAIGVSDAKIAATEDE